MSSLPVPDLFSRSKKVWAEPSCRAHLSASWYAPSIFREVRPVAIASSFRPAQKSVSLIAFAICSTTF